MQYLVAWIGMLVVLWKVAECQIGRFQKKE